jgi:hypothetical protein
MNEFQGVPRLSFDTLLFFLVKAFILMKEFIFVLLTVIVGFSLALKLSHQSIFYAFSFPKLLFADS